MVTHSLKISGTNFYCVEVILWFQMMCDVKQITVEWKQEMCIFKGICEVVKKLELHLNGNWRNLALSGELISVPGSNMLRVWLQSVKSVEESNRFLN